MFGKKQISERELMARASEQLREHGVNAPLRSAVAAERSQREGRHEEALRWRAISERLRLLMAETA